ncbi:MAG: cbb3-type cytochrome oxidase assembly protein CcoS [Candidatus Schekmanbacteria bacterium]|nr:cbb3-type cytochrome oxidase assembly protein CcoS [Candidatus Schekmanbacteria bacterium]
MSTVYIILPLALMLGGLALAAFIAALRSGQFDDLQTPAMRILLDEATHQRPARLSTVASRETTEPPGQGGSPTPRDFLAPPHEHGPERPVDLVTGATGLVGGNLVRELVGRGERVRVLARLTSRQGHLAELAGIEWVQGDITDAASLSAACAGIRRVYHCAALVSMWPGDAGAMMAVNAGGTENMLAAARAGGVERFVHCSSVDAIGLPEPGGPPATESTPWNWEHMGVATGYARSKLAAQDRVLAAVAQGLDAVIVNPALMFGPYDQKPSSGRMILEVARGWLVAFPGGGNNVVDVRDVAAAMVAAAERGRCGELYILGNANMTYREIFSVMADVTGVAPPWLPVPRLVGIAAGMAAEAFGWLTGKPVELNRESARMGFVEHYYDASKARRELGLAASPVRGAVESAVAWLRSQRMLPPASAPFIGR